MSRQPVHYIVILVMAAIGGFFIATHWREADAESGLVLEAIDEQAKQEALLREKKELPTVVKGVYLTASSAGNPKKMDAIIALIDTTELNGVVIDIKDYSGKVLYDSAVPLVNELGVKQNQIGNVLELIKKLHDHDIYVIARQTVFQDPVLAEKKPAWALKNTSGGLWRDHKGLAWVNAAEKAVWEYNRDIAREAMNFGFDEINFDYVRFPSDGNMKTVVFTHAPKKKYEVMEEFYRYLGEELSSDHARISVDLFGFVMERGGADDLQIGQRLEDAVDHVDFISPMMYPSHYPVGHLGLTNPAASPGVVIDNGMKKGVPRFEGKRAQVRPWLQAFHLGATYGAANIRAQIDMVEKYPNAGWLLWNAANRYTEAGLQAE